MKITYSFGTAFIGVLVLWMVKLYEYHIHTSLTYTWGLYPRSTYGILGIFTAPLVHGDFYHLFSNTVPFLILGGGILFFYPRLAKKVFAYIYILTGMSVWLFARPSYHIGSSGLVYGFAAFLFFSGVFRRDIKSLAIAISVAFLYGGMVVGLFPTGTGVSFESHLFGAIIGSVCAFAYKNVKEDDEVISKEFTPNPIFEGYRNIEGKNFRYEYKDTKER
ncbi:MAG: rhomboid family intramembrane serine protease [Thermoflexibacter sp.]|jgi:membrane associated rhomboid family serine protease|nr:rhomboid family intramembrane serine protease [Thermoflexibacter sp.]